MSISTLAQTTLIETFSMDLDLAAGVMKNPTHHLVRRTSDMRGYYRDVAALDALVAAGDPVHYALISFCVYPGDAGHNYGDIEREGFPKRVFLCGGKVIIE